MAHADKSQVLPTEPLELKQRGPSPWIIAAIAILAMAALLFPFYS